MAVAVDSTAEIDTDLHHNAVNVLLTIYDAEDKTATTTEIKNATGLSSANISGGHAQELERRGLIERAGSVESNAPINTNVYTTTPQGSKEANRLLKQTDAEVPMAEGEKLALLNELKENREALQQSNSAPTTNDDLVERVDELETIAEQNQDEISSIDNTLDIIYEKIDELFAKV